MTNLEQKGRTILLVLIVMVLFVSVAVIGLFVGIRGTQRLPQQLVRFVLTVIMCVFLYKGSQIVKWIAIVLFTFGWCCRSTRCLFRFFVARRLFRGDGFDLFVICLGVALVPKRQGILGLSANKKKHKPPRRLTRLSAMPTQAVNVHRRYEGCCIIVQAELDVIPQSGHYGSYALSVYGMGKPTRSVSAEANLVPRSRVGLVFT